MISVLLGVMFGVGFSVVGITLGISGKEVAYFGLGMALIFWSTVIMAVRLAGK